MKLGRYKVLFSWDFEKNVDFYDEFHISVTWNAWCIKDNVKYMNRYITFELFNRRIIQINFQTEKRVNSLLTGVLDGA